MREVSREPASQARAGGIRTAVLALVALINASGGFLLYLYYTVVDADSPYGLTFMKSGETLAIAMAPAALAVTLCFIYTRPVFEYLRVVTRAGFSPLSEGNGGGRIIHMRRRALRYPMFSAMASMSGWFLAGLVLAARVWIAGRSPQVATDLEQGTAGGFLSEELFRAGASLRMHWMFFVQSLKAVGISSLVGGMFSAVLFFVTESVWQRELPKFLPGARLSEVADPWIIPVRRRLIAIFVMVGTVPLILLGILSYQRALAMVYSPPEEVLLSILLVNLSLVVLGIALAVLLSVYVARSISDPVERLTAAMEEVARGNLSARVPVRSNDELGRVTEGFNQMARALSEKQESINELTRDLERKVDERTAELSLALREKEATQARLVQSEKMAGLGQLAAGVAHEINNPVGYIYANMDHFETYLAKAREAFDRKDEEGFKKAAEKLDQLIKSTEEGARRTKDIVQGMRTFSRRDPGARKTFDLTEAVETALTLLGHELKQGIEVKKHYGELPAVEGNPGELSQVFTNVIMNALQAMGDRGTLEIRTRREPGRAVVAIKDTGPGIKHSDLDHIFEPFFTTKSPGEGTGLGLAIAYGIVKSHNGEIEVRNEQEAGAMFEVSIPAKKETMV